MAGRKSDLRLAQSFNGYPLPKVFYKWRENKPTFKNFTNKGQYMAFISSLRRTPLFFAPCYAASLSSKDFPTRRCVNISTALTPVK